jgi:outer membrane protein OmpA-like peptidoglycan-associated protein
MRVKWFFLSLTVVFLMAACAPPSHMGVPDRAMLAPAEFAQTEAAITQAEKSAGAKHCPDKIAKAKALAKQGVETYWACRTAEAMAMLADARKLAKEAEGCTPPPPPPAPAPPPPPPPPPPVKQPISFHSVYFDFDKAILKAEAKAELDKAAKIMQDNPGVTLELQGNTDAMGTDAYNKALGDKRAKAVFDYLKAKGIAVGRLKTVSFGEAKPVAPNNTDQGRAKNRRVDLTILK